MLCLNTTECIIKLTQDGMAGSNLCRELKVLLAPIQTSPTLNIYPALNRDMTQFVAKRARLDISKQVIGSNTGKIAYFPNILVILTMFRHTDVQFCLRFLACVGEVCYRFFFYSFDCNEPKHVHIRRERMMCKFWLEPVVFAKNDGFSPKESNRIRNLTIKYIDSIVEAWDEHCGE